jgi:hypothetical protein
MIIALIMYITDDQSSLRLPSSRPDHGPEPGELRAIHGQVAPSTRRECGAGHRAWCSPWTTRLSKRSRSGAGYSVFASCSDMWRRLAPCSEPSRPTVAQTKVLRQVGQLLQRPVGLQPPGALTAAKLSELDAVLASDFAAFKAPCFDFLDRVWARHVQKTLLTLESSVDSSAVPASKGGVGPSCRTCRQTSAEGIGGNSRIGASVMSPS